MSRRFLAYLGEEGDFGEGWNGLFSVEGLKFRAISVEHVGSAVGLGGGPVWAGEEGCEPGFGAIGGLTQCPGLPSPAGREGLGGTGGGAWGL